ncbi:hypothetical protein BDZ94DRAFT_1323247 [Collybia nuda]|uniref:Uncharacterized protein n=1 Tax=Collybia nuda TaxID=64659 RepID=A0A9P5Y4Q9_9AGAR|nr:hypothetical protein BDZ94DRAFT_1323247 [Collybia nuda]
MEYPESDIDITHIIPPWLAYWAMDHKNEMREDMAFRNPIRTPRDVAETAIVSSNCLTMSKMAISLFEKSIITIDVDDNYRIIRFYEGDWVNSEMGNPLPEYFTPNGTEADKFLRAHFHYSLSVHAYGGDHQDTVPLIVVEHFMLDRGLFEENGIEFSLEDDDYTADEWNTYNGRQVLAWFQERPYEPWGDTTIEELGIGNH